MKYEHDCSIENAPKFAAWINGRGGVAIWKSIDLSDPGKSWSSPAHVKCDGCDGKGFTFVNVDSIGQPGEVQCRKCSGKGYGEPMTKPSWQCANEPRIVTDPALIEVYEAKEHKRFHVGVRMGRNDMRLKVTDGGSRRIRAEVEKAGEGSFYVFDYDAEENCVIMKTASVGSLKDWMEKNGG